MSTFNWVPAIVTRDYTDEYLKLYRSLGVQTVLGTPASGTASRSMLHFLGLEASEKTILMCACGAETEKRLMHALIHRMHIDIAGNGIALSIPLASLGGQTAAQVLIGQTIDDDARRAAKEERRMEKTAHELIIAIANTGYTDLVMESARKAKAGGGTIVHAKGTGTGLAEQFFGVKIASEKEMVLIVAKAEDRTPIMRAIMEGAGAATKAQAVVFSLPISAVAGLSAFQEEPESSETADVSAPADGPADA